jgi:hypothetical protein
MNDARELGAVDALALDPSIQIPWQDTAVPSLGDSALEPS